MVQNYQGFITTEAPRLTVIVASEETELPTKPTFESHKGSES